MAKKMGPIETLLQIPISEIRHIGGCRSIDSIYGSVSELGGAKIVLPGEVGLF